jgi:hypothetical protein
MSLGPPLLFRSSGATLLEQPMRECASRVPETAHGPERLLGLFCLPMLLVVRGRSPWRWEHSYHVIDYRLHGSR